MLCALPICGTLLIPCRTTNCGRFPLNGTYFQVNEVFADEGSTQQPIEVSRAWIWNLPRKTLNCGTSIRAIFKASLDIGTWYFLYRELKGDMDDYEMPKSNYLQAPSFAMSASEE
ncbi:DNA glycosylase/AP lyase ROS1-like [Lycium barbarum]|uniref:DNA glycosylase/AP lyase ROS1-like n=1 Tax=Lycium barbarum TaxID=112863 RepID=UPI00293E1CF7|nr:DNA glycosylase/AP lyase ROS1-like [Lycium barbarum]